MNPPDSGMSSEWPPPSFVMDPMNSSKMAGHSGRFSLDMLKPMKGIEHNLSDKRDHYELRDLHRMIFSVDRDVVYARVVSRVHTRIPTMEDRVSSAGASGVAWFES